jgi:hypothetical protein
VPWIAVASVLLIVSGAGTTGVLRAPLGNPAIGPFLLESHRIAGTGFGIVAVIRLLQARRERQWPWFPAAVVGAAVVLGWFAALSLAPGIVVIHASLGAFATAALAVPSFARLRAERPPGVSATDVGTRATWVRQCARLAFGMVLVQIAVGALLRHGLIGLVWHLLVGGLALAALLLPAVIVTQDDSAHRVERRAAQWVIAAAIVEVCLGAAVFLMIVLGPPSVGAWLAATIAHVTVGTLTLLASAAFALAIGPGHRVNGRRSAT